MITTKQELKEYLTHEQTLYLPHDKKAKMRVKFQNEHRALIFKYVRLMRISDYLYNTRNVIGHNLIYHFVERRKNKLGNKLGFYIEKNTFGSGLQIFHHGTIIVNGAARIGKNCKLHGNNCIGNTGKEGENSAPKIGDNVDIGFGACLIGDIEIADDCVIGAGAVVVKSCLIPGATIVGNPGRIIVHEHRVSETK